MKPTNHHHAHEKTHFTLLELLIALSLFATIAVAIHSALSVGMQTWKRGDQGSNMHQKARIVMDSLVSDIRRCVYFSYIQFVGTAHDIYFPVAIPVTDADKKVRGVFDTNLFKITYLLDRRSYRDKYKTLMRKQETFLQSLEPTKVKPKEFAGGIASIEFEYAFKMNEEDVDYQDDIIIWEDEWKVKDKIPQFVRVRIEMIDDIDAESKKPLTYTRTVYIPQGTLEPLPLEDEL